MSKVTYSFVRKFAEQIQKKTSSKEFEGACFPGLEPEIACFMLWIFDKHFGFGKIHPLPWLFYTAGIWIAN